METPVTYVWDFGNGETKETTEPEVSYTYQTGGAFKISVTASDDKQATTTSESVGVVPGNSRPEVEVVLTGDKPGILPTGTENRL